MFYGCWAFSADISAWDTSSVREMSVMFCTANSFNADISSWDTSAVRGATNVFYGASALDADRRPAFPPGVRLTVGDDDELSDDDDY